MTDKPIIFSEPKVRALIEGCKTQDRRVIKTQPPADCVTVHSVSNGSRWLACDTSGFCFPIRVPYAIGDRLWVREQHYLTDDGEAECVIHTADDDAVAQHHSDIARLQAQYGFSDEWAKPHLRIRNARFMPRWASRLTLIVEDVRVQRLQDITEADAKAEGVFQVSMCNDGKRIGWKASYDSHARLSARMAFHDLWNSFSGPDAWDANPWVGALTFTVHKTNIDQMEAHHD